MSYPTEWETIVPLISSDDYRDRFKGEFYELNRRIQALEKLLNDAGEGKLDFELKSGTAALKKQLKAMKDYSEVLALRAKLEDISL
jgi:hypothetical protein